jgi:hypothetical protein
LDCGKPSAREERVGKACAPGTTTTAAAAEAAAAAASTLSVTATTAAATTSKVGGISAGTPLAWPLKRAGVTARAGAWAIPVVTDATITPASAGTAAIGGGRGNEEPVPAGAATAGRHHHGIV